MDKLVTLALCVAETENSATFEPPNISAEIVELCCRGMSSHQLTRLCKEMPYAHCEWLLQRILRLFNEMADNSKKTKNHDNIKLVDLVAILLKRLHTEWNEFELQTSMRPLFRDFWFYCTIYGFNDNTLGYGSRVSESIGQVAKYSPVLIFDENEPMKQTLAQVTNFDIFGSHRK